MTFGRGNMKKLNIKDQVQVNSKRINKKIHNYLVNVLPQAYRKDDELCNSILTWLLIGIMIRLIIIPFACHGDLISTYRRSYLLLTEHNLLFLNPHEVIQAIFLAIYVHVLPLQELLFWEGVSVPTSFWLNNFVTHPYVFKTLFLFKIPYLLADIGTSFIILKLFEDRPNSGFVAYKLWMLNPITIYTFYIFGRYDSITIFIIAVGLYLLKIGRILLASLSFGFAILDRYYPVIFLPILFGVYKKKRFYTKVLMLIASLIPLLIYTCIIKSLNLKFQYYGIDFAKSDFINYVTAMKFRLDGLGQEIYLFIVFYIILLAFIFLYDLEEKKAFQDFVLFSLATLLIFYSTSIFHPQYFSWFILFLAIYYGHKQDDKIIAFHTLQAMLFVFYTFYWGKATFGWMFSSLAPQILTNLASPFELINEVYPSLKLINMCRSALSGVSISMVMYTLYKRIRVGE